MRIRHKPYARGELAAWAPYIDEPALLRGKWASVYRDASLPFRLELGCGKGGFIAALGLRERDCNYLGVDIKSEVLVVAKRNIERLYGEAGQEVDNLRLTSQDIERIGDILSPEDVVDRIYINFCNPWYKTGHAKHRLTHPRQLVRYRHFLRPEGEIWFKTDDDPLFNDTLRYFPIAGYEIIWQTRDLHAEEPAWNIRTEHEEMFAEQGIPIKACIAKMQPAQLDEERILLLKDV